AARRPTPGRAPTTDPREARTPMSRGHTISKHRASFVPAAIAYSLLLGLTLGMHTLTNASWSVLLPAAIAAAAIAHYLYNQQHAWELTSEQVIAHTGVLVRDVQVIRLDRITDMRVRTPLLASILGTGAVLISTAGSDGYELTIFRQHQASRIEAQIARAKRAYIASNPSQTPTP